jgi:outer membrane cobalamin receptor
VRTIFTLFLLTTSLNVSYSQTVQKLHGYVKNTEKESIPYTSITIPSLHKEYEADEKGYYVIDLPEGTHTLQFQMVGYQLKTVTYNIPKDCSKSNLVILQNDESQQLDEIVIQSKSPIEQVKESAYNVVALDATSQHNTTKDLAKMLNKASGVRLRETGGVGSDMQLMVDGFNGKHVKVFIDGVPQEGVGSSFGLNNIPINFAERIEVYKGVIPVEFGTDALGGVINIVTKKSKNSWFLDASYAFGSFNTFKTYVNFGQTLKNGFHYELNVLQNYSDNNYYIDTPVKDFETGAINRKKIEHVKRFHNNYHNEAVVAKVGFKDKKWADRFFIGVTYSEMYKEIQNGVRQEIVYGDKHHRGNSIMPSLEYRKKNLFTKGLNAAITANYNKNINTSIDTSKYEYNWHGDSRLLRTPGEQSYQHLRSTNNNFNTTFNLKYDIAHKHYITLNNVYNTFERSNYSLLEKSSSSNAIKKNTSKNITGLSYMFKPNNLWNATVFGKYYYQSVGGPVAINVNQDLFERKNSSISSPGYGIATSYFIIPSLQAKVSYEKVYRLPSIDEMFGNEDLESGDIAIKPENSDNYNFNLSYNKTFKKHNVYFEGGLVYRDVKDYIMRTLQDLSGGKTGATYINHGKVETKGYNLTLRYGYSDWLSVGGSFSQMDIRDNVKTLRTGTGQESPTYGARMPNIPYLFANSDITLNFKNLIKPETLFTVAYDNIYMESFPLYSEALGSESKFVVPKQFSHNIALTYSTHKGKYNFTVECQNILDEQLYDNFSLQKAGRAFYAKFRINLGKISN